jgi:D-alanyl-lipoteichoic acid acyltransferase DltB (MBOAT superfamily)
MSLSKVLILIGAALIIRLAFPGKLRKWALLVASVVAIYWLQPVLPIRNMDFWFPTATIGLVFVIWGLTAEKAQLTEKKNVLAAGMTIGTILLIGLTRLISLEGILTASRPPQFLQVLIALFIILSLGSLLTRLFKPSKGFLLGGVVLLLLLFVLIKNPPLSKLVSGGLRGWMNQNPDLAKPTDLGWLGFSYVAFRLIHTLLDRINARLKTIDLGELLVYTIFFPAFMAGPLDRLQNFRKDLENPKPLSSDELFTSGKRIALGLFRKFLIADSLAFIAISGTNVLQVQKAGWLWLMLFAYSFQIFFDFAGYTDMAIGLGQLTGFRLPENFNKPYRQTNLTLFWNNWHMSLTQWFRGYFFNPFTRSLRKGRKLPAPLIILITQLSTFVVIGLWHGITWNFIAWGAWHGVGLFLQNRWSSFFSPKVSQITQNRPSLGTIVTVVSVLLTFLYVSLGWVWFALPSPSLSIQTLAKLFGWS